jgi:hypothetical protein
VAAQIYRVQPVGAGLPENGSFDAEEGALQVITTISNSWSALHD